MKGGLKAVDQARERRRRFYRLVGPLTATTLLLVVLFVGKPLIRTLRGDRGLQTTSAARPTPRVLPPPRIEIRGASVLVDGVPVDDVTSVIAQQRLMRLDRLFDELKGRRIATDPSYDPGVGGTPMRAVVHASPDTPAVAVKSVIQTAAFAGFGDIDFDGGL